MQKYYKYKIDNAVNVSKIVTIHYFELTKDFEYAPESHDFWEISYLDKGHIFCHSGDTTNELSQGDLVVCKPMLTHSLSTDKEIACNLCVVSFECKSPALMQIMDGVYSLSPIEKKLMSKIFEEAGHTFFLPKLEPGLKKMRLKDNVPLGSLQIIKNSLEELLIRLLRRDIAKENNDKLLNSYDDDLVNTIISYLEKNVSKTLSLNDIERFSGYKKTFLCTKFKEATGKSIFRFFNELKIEESKKIIRSNKNISFSSISDALNFSEPAYFTSVFKKITGMTPKEYSLTIHAFDKN